MRCSHSRRQRCGAAAISSGGMGVKSAGGGLRAALRVVLLSHITSFAVLVAMLRTAAADSVSAARAAGVGTAAGVPEELAADRVLHRRFSRGAMGASAANERTCWRSGFRER